MSELTGPAEIHNGLALYQRGQGYPLLRDGGFLRPAGPGRRAVLTTVSPATPRAWWLLNVSAR